MRLTNLQRAMAVGQLNAGRSFNDVAEWILSAISFNIITIVWPSIVLILVKLLP